MRPIIIDADPGYDDVLALTIALAHKEELEILGITTVAGNAPLDEVTAITLQFLELMDKDIKVYKGAEKPLVGPVVRGHFAKGGKGMYGVSLPQAQGKAQDKDAITYIIETLESSNNPLDLVVLGPMTNIALVLNQRPDLKDKIKTIYFMGGGFYAGNVTAAAEFNIYADPEAAAIVFNSGVKLVMSGTDVARDLTIDNQSWQAFKDKGRILHYYYELFKVYTDFETRLGYPRPVLYDPSVIAYLLHPEIFILEDYYVQVECKGELTRGMTLRDNRVRSEHLPNMSVMMRADRKAFSQLLVDSIEKLALKG